MFEFDPKKSALNQEKHGINFADAQQLWSVPSVIFESNQLEEKRWLLIGALAGVCWTAVFTKRGNKIRIISVRRSRKQEMEVFYENS